MCLSYRTSPYKIYRNSAPGPFAIPSRPTAWSDLLLSFLSQNRRTNAPLAQHTSATVSTMQPMRYNLTIIVSMYFFESQETRDLRSTPRRIQIRRRNIRRIAHCRRQRQRNRPLRLRPRNRRTHPRQYQLKRTKTAHRLQEHCKVARPRVVRRHAEDLTYGGYCARGNDVEAVLARAA
jgi:hypothetical protein